MLAGLRPASPWARSVCPGAEPPDPHGAGAAGMITNNDPGQARRAVRAHKPASVP
jgi:hypothetical protein